jgi:hypothetical protein
MNDWAEGDEILHDSARVLGRAARAVNRVDDYDTPTGPLTPGQVKCISCQENERSRAASSPVDGLCTFCRDSGDARRGHQFHFQVLVQGAHRGADGLYHDEVEPVEYEPFMLTVRAWNLAAACRRAAETPLGKWTPFREEQG